jgi:glycerol-3-phosphate cytidylyltransferase-like family protein
MRIYFPVTCNILTPGHIMCLEQLSRKGYVIVGLLTAKALRGYKKEIVPFEDRKYILDTVAMGIGDIEVVAQDSLNPSKNLVAYNCHAIASGDGWEKEELEAIHKLDISIIDLKLEGEVNKKYSSSRILNS